MTNIVRLSRFIQDNEDLLLQHIEASIEELIANLQVKHDLTYDLNTNEFEVTKFYESDASFPSLKDFDNNEYDSAMTASKSNDSESLVCSCHNDSCRSTNSEASFHDSDPIGDSTSGNQSLKSYDSLRERLMSLVKRLDKAKEYVETQSSVIELVDVRHSYGNRVRDTNEQSETTSLSLSTMTDSGISGFEFCDIDEFKDIKKPRKSLQEKFRSMFCSCLIKPNP